MSAKIELYIDTYSGELVSGTDNRRAATLPKFVYGDDLTFWIYQLERTTTYPDAGGYAVVNNAAHTLKMALGSKATGALVTQQYTWTPDAQNQYFYATLPMDTAAILALLNSTAQVQSWFEIKRIQGGRPTTILQKEVILNASVILPSSVTVPANERPLSLEYGEAAYLKAENTGCVIVNPNTGAKVQMYLGDDGVVHFDPIA